MKSSETYYELSGWFKSISFWKFRFSAMVDEYIDNWNIRKLEIESSLPKNLTFNSVIKGMAN